MAWVVFIVVVVVLAIIYWPIALGILAVMLCAFIALLVYGHSLNKKKSSNTLTREKKNDSATLGSIYEDGPPSTIASNTYSNSAAKDESQAPKWAAGSTDSHIINNQSSAVKEHFDLVHLIQEYYKKGDYKRCEKYCLEDIDNFPSYATDLGREFGFDPNGEIPLQLVSFETLAKVYEKQARYDDAIEICDIAINYNVHDGTKGDFAGRKIRMEKLKDTPKERAQLRSVSEPENSLISRSNEIINNDFPDLDWYVAVSFGKSTSQNFFKALALAQASFKYYEFEYEGQKTYQAVFTSESNQYLHFVSLYELVSGWKSSFAVVNGKLVDRKIIGGLNYCYGDKCRSGNPTFCYGASPFTRNPFGCHRLQISAWNNPWWAFSTRQGSGRMVDKEAIRKRVHEYGRPYLSCPAFDYDGILKRLDELPDYIANETYAQFANGTLLDTDLRRLENR